MYYSIFVCKLFIYINEGRFIINVLQIKASDKLSTMVCNQCMSKVNNWINYRRSCSENQCKLMDWLNAWNSSNTPGLVSVPLLAKHT